MTYLVDGVILDFVRAQTVTDQVQVQDLCHPVAVPQNVLQVRVVPGLVAGRKHREVLHVPHAGHKLGVKVVDGFPELVERSVLLFLQRPGKNSGY